MLGGVFSTRVCYPLLLMPRQALETAIAMACIALGSVGESAEEQAFVTPSVRWRDVSVASANPLACTVGRDNRMPRSESSEPTSP